MDHDVLTSAESVANDDVREAIAWLRSEGFDLFAGSGGHGEAFGNVSVTLARDSAVVAVVRGRSQWSCAIGGGYQTEPVPVPWLAGRRPRRASGELDSLRMAR